MSDAFDRLVAIMDRLRDPGGCPWDREQTVNTLSGYLLEEAYEVVDAIAADDGPRLREELGDLLLQIVFLAGSLASGVVSTSTACGRRSREDGAPAPARLRRP
jgi:uncharacterized protein YabN with tetrapyrrole methylase and pyrophosphatase domain